MARTLRKTIRRKKSIRSHIFGGVVVAAAVLLLASNGWPFAAKDWITAIVVLVMVVAMATEDQLNGWLAGRKMLPGTETSETVFTAEGYVTKNEAAETHWRHEQIKAAFETKDYFVFFLSDRHGQIYDKNGFIEGTPEEFCAFISEQTGKPVEYIK